MNVPFKLAKDALAEMRRTADQTEEDIERLESRLRDKYQQLSELREDILELEDFLRSNGEGF